MSLLPLLVICASILAFFLDEFAQTFKKIFAIRGIRIVLPLFIVSSCVIWLSNGILTCLLWFQTYFRYLMVLIFQCLPYKLWAGIIAQWCVIFLVASVPTWCLYGILKYKQWGRPTVWATHTYLILWIVLVILWVA